MGGGGGQDRFSKRKMVVYNLLNPRKCSFQRDFCHWRGESTPTCIFLTTGGGGVHSLATLLTQIVVSMQFLNLHFKSLKQLTKKIALPGALFSFISVENHWHERILLLFLIRLI